MVPAAVTTPFSFTKTKSRDPNPTRFTTTTTMRPKLKATPSWDRNTARPEYSQFQLDPSLLHNGFLFDKRKMEEIEEKRRIKSPEKKLTFTTPRPEVLKEQQYFSTIAPKQIVTTRRPTFYDQPLRPQDFGNHKYLPIEQPKPRFSMPIKTATSSPMYDSK